LKLAAEYGLKSIAFPSISTGAYGYPIDKAVKIAFKAVADFSEHESTIKELIFVLYSDENLQVYERFFNNI
jgi:O-acetyl-ADP-ribose deacetylase (regulator of RNase III)